MIEDVIGGTGPQGNLNVSGWLGGLLRMSFQWVIAA